MNARRSERLVDVALGEPERGAWRRLGVAAVVAVVFYGGLGTWGAIASSSLARWGDAVTAKVHRILSHENPIALPPPPKPPAPKPKSPPPPPPQPAPPEPVAKAAPPKPAPSRAVHRAPARAAKIIAAAPSGPVAMEEVTFATGSAAHYAGGSTASNGTSDTAVHGPIDRSPPPPPPTPPPPGPDHSAPVGLGDTDWSCPWPAAADDADIDEQAVTLRVRVASSGAPLAAEVLTDPGHGFAAAAHTCALQTQYTPARDRRGHAIEALSPPIRVHFIR